MNIYIDLNGKKAGPYTLEEVKSRVHSGILNGSELVCLDEATNWIALSTLISIPNPQSKSVEKNEFPVKIYLAKEGDNPAPHSLDEVNQMLRSGTLDRNDLAFHSGLTTWAPVHAINGVISQVSQASFPSVPISQQQPQTPSPIRPTKKRTLTLGQYFTRGRGELKRNLSWDVFSWALVIVVLAILTGIITVTELPAGQLILNAIYPLFFGCPTFLSLKRLRGVTLTPGDLTPGFGRGPLRLLILGVLMTIVQTLGFALLRPLLNDATTFLAYAPGYVFSFLTQFATFLIVDKEQGVFSSMWASCKAVSTKLPFVLVFNILSLLVFFVGVLGCGVCGLITGAISYYAWCFLYLDIFDPASIPVIQPTQPQHQEHL